MKRNTSGDKNAKKTRTTVTWPETISANVDYYCLAMRIRGKDISPGEVIETAVRRLLVENGLNPDVRPTLEVPAKVRT